MSKTTTTAPILARMAPVALADMSAAPEEIMCFPAGTHTINASQGGQPVTKLVIVGPDTAVAMQTALLAHLNTGAQKPYFDFDHDDTKASAWPLAYRWESGAGGLKPGVYAKVEWSASGAAAVLGKDYRSFSPAFHVDGSKPARVTGGPLNLGGLVNAPAFRAQAPLWAKDQSSAAAPDQQNQNTTTMTEEEKQAAAAAAATAEAEKKKADAVLAAEAVKAKETVTVLTTQVAALLAKEAARVKSDAAAKVAAAVARGALPPKDEAIQAKWRGLIESDASHADLLAAMPGNDITQTHTSTGGHIVVKAGAVEVLKAYNAAKGANDRAVIYAKDIKPLFVEGFSLGPILAANSLGTLAGDLTVQRALTLLKLSYPFLFSISTNFSEANAAFNQVVMTRLKSALVANEFDADTGYGDNNATTTDVPVTINHNIGVPVSFNVNELASTERDLFGEQSEGMHNALATAIVDALFALITAGNFANHTDSKLSLFNRPVVRQIGKAMNIRKVGKGGRFLLLNPDFHEKLGQDASIVSLAAFQKPEIITEMTLPRVAGFQPYEAESLPTANALAGLAGNSETFALVTRLPNDYTAALPGASNGSVSTVKNLDTGISVQQVQYVNHDLARATSRTAVMFGVAKGNAATAERLLQTAE